MIDLLGKIRKKIHLDPLIFIQIARCLLYLRFQNCRVEGYKADQRMLTQNCKLGTLGVYNIVQCQLGAMRTITEVLVPLNQIQLVLKMH